MVWKYKNNQNNLGLFSIFYYGEEQNPQFSVVISKKELIRTIYQGFINYFQSEKFNKSEWELKKMRDLLEEYLQKDSSVYFPILMSLKSEELKRLFFNLNPEFKISFRGIEDPKESLKLFAEYSLNDDEGENSDDIIKTPVEYEIPDDYDTWENHKKEKFLNECLDEPANGWSGSKVDDFHSQIIEKYLTN